MRLEAIALLYGFIKSQKNEANRIFQEIKSANLSKDSSKKTLVYVGYLLHNLYCAIEEIFKETAKTFENQIQDPIKYHRELLKKMHVEVPRIRPALLAKESFELLDELRGFRHLFRHAYTYPLDSEKLAQLKHKIEKKWGCVQLDLQRFEAFLEKHLESLQES